MFTEGGVEVGRVEVRDAVPQRDVGRRRLLRLYGDDLADGVGGAQPLAGEQELPGERRSVELPGGDAAAQSARQMYGGSIAC